MINIWINNALMVDNFITPIDLNLSNGLAQKNIFINFTTQGLFININLIIYYGYSVYKEDNIEILFIDK